MPDKAIVFNPASKRDSSRNAKVIAAGNMLSVQETSAQTSRISDATICTVKIRTLLN